MPKIEKEILLNCSPKEAFAKMSQFDFIKQINSAADVDTKVVFQNSRIIRYSINVKHVGEWESERILIPESNLIVTHRRVPLSPFTYMVIIYALKEHNQGTRFIYIEEFEVENKNKQYEERIVSDISKKVNSILTQISDYFNETVN